MRKNVHLVVAASQLLRDFPDSKEIRDMVTHNTGPNSLNYEVEPERCTTQLGAWLATHIDSTRFEDGGSRCSVVLPCTEEGLRVLDLANKLPAYKQIQSPSEAEELYTMLEGWIEERRGKLEMYGDDLFGFRVIEFEWPVFGSKAADQVKTPEAYFDCCAKQIRDLGGVILKAGVNSTELPESIAQTMADGKGMQLLGSYYDQMQRARV